MKEHVFSVSTSIAQDSHLQFPFSFFLFSFFHFGSQDTLFVLPFHKVLVLEGNLGDAHIHGASLPGFKSWDHHLVTTQALFHICKMEITKPWPDEMLWIVKKLIYGDIPRKGPSNAIVIMVNGNITTTKRDCTVPMPHLEMGNCEIMAYQYYSHNLSYSSHLNLTISFKLYPFYSILTCSYLRTFLLISSSV